MSGVAWASRTPQGARVRPHDRRPARLRGRPGLRRARRAGAEARARDALAHGGALEVDRRDARPRDRDADTGGEARREGAQPDQGQVMTSEIRSPLVLFYDAASRPKVEPLRRFDTAGRLELVESPSPRRLPAPAAGGRPRVGVRA